MKINPYGGEKEEHVSSVKIDDNYHLSSKKDIF